MIKDKRGIIKEEICKFISGKEIMDIVFSLDIIYYYLRCRKLISNIKLTKNIEVFCHSRYSKISSTSRFDDSVI